MREGGGVNVNIRIFWGTGSMVVDADAILDELTMTAFKKWCRLFIRYGELADHPTLIAYCKEKMRKQKEIVQVFEGEIKEFQGKIDGTIPTVLAKKYLREEIRLKQRHLNGATQNLTRLEKKYTYLKEVLNL